MSRLRRTLAAALTVLLLSACASTDAAAQPPSPPCSEPEYRQMDFWLGTWDVEWDATPSMPAGRGANVITRELGLCVIQEAFDGGSASGGMIGRSISVFDQHAGLWRQTWVDNLGGYIALAGGQDADGRFVLSVSRLGDRPRDARMVFEDIAENSLTWRWQSREEGEEAWEDSWVIRYTRRGSR